MCCYAMKQKGLAPILIIIIIASVLGGYLLYTKQIKPTSLPQKQIAAPQSTPDETVNPDLKTVKSQASLIGANWKTYIDTHYGYSLKYPKNWSLEESGFAPEADGYTTTITSPGYQHPGFTQLFNITITHTESIEVYGEERIKKSKYETLNNYQIIKIPPTPNYPSEIVLFKVRDRLYLSFKFDPYSEESPFPNQNETYQIANQILSTFQLLNLTDIPDSSDWKTYKNNYFSFKYHPSEWDLKDTNNSNSTTELANITLTKKNPEREVRFLARTPGEKPGFTQEITELFKNKEKITIDGVAGFVSTGYSNKDKNVFKSVIQLTQNNIEYYILENSYIDTTFGDFDQLLSTVKFIN